MLTVTEKAREKIAAFFEGKDPRPIRIFLSNGCSGPRFALGLDDAKPEDTVIEIAEVEFLVDTQLLDQAQPINIDFLETGFEVSSPLELKGGCGGCGSSTSCCGC